MQDQVFGGFIGEVVLGMVGLRVPQVVGELLKGRQVRGDRPGQWSVTEKTGVPTD